MSSAASKTQINSTAMGAADIVGLPLGLGAAVQVSSGPRGAAKRKAGFNPSAIMTNLALSLSPSSSSSATPGGNKQGYFLMVLKIFGGC